jgi:2'-5' RNA ligase
VSFADLRPGTHASAVRNHWWWRPGWAVGRRFYACHLPLGHEPELRRIAGRYREALKSVPGIDFIPDEWLHLTLHGIGFADEISEDALRVIITELQMRLRAVDPVTITVAAAVVSDEAIVMPVEPVTAVAKLRAMVQAAVAHVRSDVEGASSAQYRPHISIGYFNTDGPAQPYVDAIEPVHAEPATLTIRSVPVIAMHRDRGMYEWSKLADARLG